MSGRVFAYLDKAVAIEPLVVFRLVFGALMLFSTIRFMALGWVEDHFVNPVFHFKYFGFEWIPVLSAEWMYGVHIVMAVAALGVLLGLYYRVSAVVLFLSFSYTELVDLTYYLNHYYFVSIVAGLMILVPANRAFAIDVIRKPGLASDVVPAWSILIFKLQLAIVYMYAGLAKINYDWLIDALPLRIWMPANDHLPLIGWIFTLSFMPYVFSWMGMLYDCTIVFWLSNRRTRPYAYVSVIFFHLITGLMFQIGVFPLVMVGATLLFFSEQWHKQLVTWLRKLLSGIADLGVTRPDVATASVLQRSSWSILANKTIIVILIAHFAFQLLFPWRFLLYPGNVFWTEEGYRYSWRVMLMEKAGTATFYVKDGQTGREGMVINSDFLNPHQEKQMAMQPDLILQYAKFLKAWYEQKGMVDPQVRAEVYVTLNAKPSKLMIDPNINLAEVEDGWSHKRWILPHQQ